MGIDPGIARLGWAIVETTRPNPRPIAYGCITTKQTDTAPERLLAAHSALKRLLTQYHPACVSVEDLFFATNAKTAISVGQARGVVLLAAAQFKIPVVSYSPLAIKQTICGDGKADKMQVQHMVTKILRLSRVPQPDDAADALAIAMTHAYSYKLKEKMHD